MPNTPRMKFPFPARNKEPYFDEMEAFFNAVDTSSYASREDRHIVLLEGGTVSFNSTTGVLDWTADIEILSPITGFKWLLQGPAQVTLDEGEVFFTDLVRAPTQNRTVAPSTSTQVPSTDNSLLIAVRSNNTVWFRNGLSLAGGESAGGVGLGGSGIDTTAIHDNVDAEISPIASKTPVGADVILIEDSADSFSKKSATIATLPVNAHTVASHSDTSTTGPQLNTLAGGGNADALHVHAHSAVTGQTADDHHAQAHTVASHSDTTATGPELDNLTDGTNADGLHAHAHSAVTGQTADDHHNEAHTVASHSDTTATGPELNELVGGGGTTLHSHAGGGLVFSTGAAKVAFYTIPFGEIVRVDPSGGSFVVAPTSSPSVNDRLGIKNVTNSTNAITFDADTGLETVDGQLATGLINPFECQIYQYNGTEWSRVTDALASAGVTQISDAPTVQQDDYAPTGWDDCSMLIISPTVPVDITGFAKPSDPLRPHRKTIVQGNGNAVTLKHANSGSSAANRLLVPGGSDHVNAAQNDVATIEYDDITDAWRLT